MALSYDQASGDCSAIHYKLFKKIKLDSALSKLRLVFHVGHRHTMLTATNEDGTLFVIDVGINRQVMRISPFQSISKKTPLFGCKFGETSMKKCHVWEIERLQSGTWKLLYKVRTPAISPLTLSQKEKNSMPKWKRQPWQTFSKAWFYRAEKATRNPIASLLGMAFSFWNPYYRRQWPAYSTLLSLSFQKGKNIRIIKYADASSNLFDGDNTISVENFSDDDAGNYSRGVGALQDILDEAETAKGVRYVAFRRAMELILWDGNRRMISRLQSFEMAICCLFLVFEIWNERRVLSSIIWRENKRYLPWD